MLLWDGETPPSETRGDLDTLEIRCAQFINRWGWKTDKDAMRRELDALIAWAKEQA